MLKFWKKSENRLKQPQNVEPSETVEIIHRQQRQQQQQQQETLPLALEDEDLLYDLSLDTTKSKLCKTLDSILTSDKTALSYFVQYMEVRNASQYVHCYLDIETFKADLQASEPSSIAHLVKRTDHDSLSVSSDSSSDYTSDSKTPDPIEFSTLIPDKLVEGALAIFKKYVALEARLDVNCPEPLRREVIENICDSSSLGSAFDSVQRYLFDTMQTEYFGCFLESDFFAKHQIDVLTSGNVALEDVLYNETALFYFMEFLEQENKRGLLEFWIAANNLQQQLKDQKEFFDPIEAQNDAIVLYDKYFSLQAHCPLGFDDRVRLEVEQNICGENGLVLTCFSGPLAIVERYLDRHYLKPFLASQLFYKYLSELINTVQASGYSTNMERRSKYSPSDCSSEKSFSAGTFLALEIPYEHRKGDKTDMSIDSRELYDPDTLWKRKKAHRLSLGRVTELGQYVGDIEPEPDRRGFKFKDVVKKIVSLDEEEKRKEEMAWKVAEMIVKDITNVTLK